MYLYVFAVSNIKPTDKGVHVWHLASLQQTSKDNWITASSLGKKWNFLTGCVSGNVQEMF